MLSGSKARHRPGAAVQHGMDDYDDNGEDQNQEPERRSHGRLTLAEQLDASFWQASR